MSRILATFAIASWAMVGLGGNGFGQTRVIPASAQSTTYRCPKCGQLHARPVTTVTSTAETAVETAASVPASSAPVARVSAVTDRSNSNAPPSTQQTSTTQQTPTIERASTIEPTVAEIPMASSSRARAGGGVMNVLAQLNAQRARMGVRTLRFDPVLQAVAQRRAELMASRGLKGHPPGSFAPGRYEGVGWSGSYSPSKVSACFTSDPRMQYAGAAMATGRDGVYFAVVYR